MKCVLRLFIFLSLLMAVACGDSPIAAAFSKNTVVVSPSAVTLVSGASQQFTANQTVSWTATAGTITANGFFVAPTVSVQTTVTITAKNVSPPRTSGTAIVVVNPVVAPPPPPPPTVASISPASGTANGGTAVTISGTGFLSGAAVSFGGTAATGVTVSSTTITATTPAHPAGAVDVVVKNTDNQTGTLSGGYTYTPALGSINYVQGKSTTITSASLVATTMTSAQTAGNLNVVEVMWGDTTSTVSSITDSQGNTYALAVSLMRIAGLSSATYYAKNIVGGSNTVTVSFNQTASYPNVNVLEYSGLDTVNPLDVFSSATGSGTTANSGSATTTSASELIVGAGNPSSGFTGAGTGFTNRIINAFGGISEDRIVSSTGSYNATAIMTTGNWVMQMAAFRASGQASQPSPVATISPSSVTLPSGGTQQFTANQTVTWSTSLGGITSTGLYTAPSVSTQTLVTITGTNANGVGQAAVTVQALILPPPTATIAANPASIALGGSSTLSWATTNATGVSITNVGTEPANGSIVVSPSGTTTYALTATGSGGTATASATVTVSQAIQHSVLLSWTPSTTVGAIYNIYRKPVGGSYSLLSGSIVGTSWTDNTVVSGQTYLYVATAFYQTLESTYSNEVTVVIPTP